MTTLTQNSNISTILKQILNYKSLTVSELARLLKIPQPTIHRITSGIHTKPHRKTLDIIAQFFNISLEQLCGQEIIPWLNVKQKNIPILSTCDCLKFPNYNTEKQRCIIAEVKVNSKTFAYKMSDASMEPLIPYGSLLIIDALRTPYYRCIVMLRSSFNILIRQLIIDDADYYVKPLSPDFTNKPLQLIENKKEILGVVIEVRMQFKDED